MLEPNGMQLVLYGAGLGAPCASDTSLLVVPTHSRSWESMALLTVCFRSLY